MTEALEFIFASPWRFLGVLILVAVAALWTPIRISRGDEE